MLDFLRTIFSTNGFEAHYVHFTDNPGLMWFLIVGNILVAIAYVVLPAELSYIYFKRRDFAFSWVFIVTAFFGVWCSATHIMAVVVFWYPLYWLEGIISAITGIVSIGAFLFFIIAVPLMLKLTGPKKLDETNKLLDNEIRSRKQSEEKLTLKNKELERANKDLISKNDELTKVNKSIVDREFKIIELKKEIERLRML